MVQFRARKSLMRRIEQKQGADRSISEQICVAKKIISAWPIIGRQVNLILQGIT